MTGREPALLSGERGSELSSPDSRRGLNEVKAGE
jgi:hypothetical protein